MDATQQMPQMQPTVTASSANVKTPTSPAASPEKTANTDVQTLANDQRARNIPAYRYLY